MKRKLAQKVKKYEMNIIPDKSRMQIGMTICLFLMASSLMSLGQSLDCPIRGGKFKNFDSVEGNHHNPEDGAVVLGVESDSVHATVEGRIIKVFSYEINEHSVVLMTNDSIVLAYRFLRDVFLKEGEYIRKGAPIGVANINSRGSFEVGLIYRTKSGPVDPRLVLRCKN